MRFLSILWLTSLRLASCRCKPWGFGAGTSAQRKRNRRPGAATLQSSCRYSSVVWLPCWLKLHEITLGWMLVHWYSLAIWRYMALRVFSLTFGRSGLEGGARAQLKRSWRSPNAALWSKCWRLAHFSLASGCKSAVRSCSVPFFGGQLVHWLHSPHHYRVVQVLEHEYSCNQPAKLSILKRLQMIESELPWMPFASFCTSYFCSFSRHVVLAWRGAG